ncbi:MAG TPA: hypothetical protein PL164_00295 [Candidatus Paceibacterota bacterium]|nr:hypothetical protein [Candidatus Paceibacterota bacterium]HOK97312.1 hypothetical protein [Candidatus Paceibacterota bacterium]HPP64795.1 hypothetical protein [Candidatus Paceibacterota bacterium]
MDQNFLKLFPPELQETIKALYDVILERALSRAYQNLDEERKALMAEIFSLDNEKAKENFLKEYLKDLDSLIVEETKKIIEEIKK